MITLDELKNNIENIGYYATDEIIYDTYNALCMFDNKNGNEGQDIFALCLEGPPGAGKTEYAKTYYKLLKKMYGDSNVQFVEYQCDATTGKTELFEDINISAAIRRDADNVNIPGKLIEAINKVNEGKKVVLFIDEYDKAREETDAFLLQFLQSGKINSTQHGDLEIKDEYKANLHVILCKNDMREELSGPLSRRIRIIRLDYMLPEIFYKVAHLNLIENKEIPVNDGLLNLVTLMYEHAYGNKDLYNRLPSASEMMIAISDADRLMQKANAPKNIIYHTIIKNMFKSLDDINTFESDLEHMRKQEDSMLVSMIKSMKIVDDTDDKIDVNDLIAKTLFKDKSDEFQKEIDKYAYEIQGLQNLINEFKEKFADLEERKKEELAKIKLEGGKLVQTKKPDMIRLFEDESVYIKRGYSIFDSEDDWVEVGYANVRNLSVHFLIEKLKEIAADLDITIFEDGIIIDHDDNYKLVVVFNLLEFEMDKERTPQIKFYINNNYTPVKCFESIIDFLEVVSLVREENHTVKKIIDDAVGFGDYYCFNVLVESNLEIPGHEKVGDNIYNVDIRDNYSFDEIKDKLTFDLVADEKKRVIK